MIFKITDAYGGLSSVASAVFADVSPYMILVIGIVLAFFIIEVLIEIFDRKEDKRVMDKANKAMAEFESLHKEGKV
jgi:hypothetical protein